MTFQEVSIFCGHFETQNDQKPNNILIFLDSSYKSVFKKRIKLISLYDTQLITFRVKDQEFLISVSGEKKQCGPYRSILILVYTATLFDQNTSKTFQKQFTCTLVVIAPLRVKQYSLFCLKH